MAKLLRVKYKNLSIYDVFYGMYYMQFMRIIEDTVVMMKYDEEG